MPQNDSLPQTETYVADSTKGKSRLSGLISRLRIQNLRGKLAHYRDFVYVGHLLAVAIATGTAAVVVSESQIVHLLENHAQTLFFDIRGPVAPPVIQPSSANSPAITILTMDGSTMDQGALYATDPSQYSYFEPIARWPWKRTAYAIVIDRLMQAGAKAVVMDVVLDAPSSYGTEDDERLRQTLAKYPGRVVLAAQYLDEGQREGIQTKLLMPNPVFQSTSPLVGFIDFLLSPDGRIHKLGSEYPKYIAQTYPDYLAKALPTVPSLAESSLTAANTAYPESKGNHIFFYGPKGTFEQTSFWQVLDPDSWNNYHLKEHTFKDKIVLIGPTGGGESFQDFHAAPFSSTLLHPEKMAGVEIQANAIATLMEGKAIATALPNPWAQGALVIILILGSSYLISLTARPLRRFAVGIAIAIGWGTVCYSVFVVGRLILPTTVPMLAISTTSLAYLFTGVIREKLNMSKLTNVMKRYVSSPVVQELISDVKSAVPSSDLGSDLETLIEKHNQEIVGKKLRGRYQVIEALQAGGFGQTFIAEDTDRPGHPRCVVKRLKPAASNNPKVMKLAHNLFQREAETLEHLGTHNQIPQLLAHFEEQDEFYLVQEYIDGRSLAEELNLGSLQRRLPEKKVVSMLHELLNVLEFVHQQGVIHRDIKPGNIIRRNLDGKLVLIDFGAVKQLQNLEENHPAPTQLTVAIGTDGYMAPEQADGRPCPASDLYSVGITAIQALTGMSASDLKQKRDPRTTELIWKEDTPVSHTLASLLDKMVAYKFTERYVSANEALKDLEPLIQYTEQSLDDDDSLPPPSLLNEDLAELGETKPWPEAL